MPPGDAQRVWFPEMLEDLRNTWSKAMTWEELSDFCHRMTEKRREIRHSRGIEPPRMRCPKCGQVSRSDISGVSIRSALFALKKIDAVTEVDHKALDKGWMSHKKRNRLDAYGRQVEPPENNEGDESNSCC